MRVPATLGRSFVLVLRDGMPVDLPPVLAAHFWRLSVAALLGLGALLVATVVSGQSVERSVYASVLNQAGAPVTDLTARDFIVRENDIEREVLRVSPATEAFQIALLVDNSQAAGPHISDLRNGLLEFVKAMAGQNEIALVGFGQRPTILVAYTRDLGRLSQGAGRLFAESNSGAYVLDAIIEVGRGLRKREGSRRAFVVISTQGAEFSERYHKHVLGDLLESGAALHAFVIGVSNDLGRDDARERSLTLDQGARMTGGRQEDLLTSSSLPGRMRDLAAELKNQYRVVYARPPATIPPESIEVSVRRKDLTVRAPRVLPKQ